MSDDRFIEIETRLAHQDQLLIELNAALTKHQETIMTLERRFASMAERIASLGEALTVTGNHDERPPHY